jgi:hypothetical protein
MRKNLTIFICSFVILSGCPAVENTIPETPVENIIIRLNKSQISGGITLIEGQSVILEAELTPKGVQGGVHWESSNKDVLMLSGLSGQEITITGASGGKTIIFVTARNGLNELSVSAECSVTVISRSFFKWSYQYTDWIDLPVLEANSNYYLYDAGKPVLIRAGETDILAYTGNPATSLGGILLSGQEARLIIGSGMTTPTNSPFPDHPVYDKNGQFDFLNGPGAEYNLWAGRTRISVDYEILDSSKSMLRIFVNNNTNELINASAINNSLVAELTPSSPRSGTLTGIFDNTVSTLINDKNIQEANETLTEEEKLQRVLSHSFITLAIPDGKILIRSIKIESYD